MVDRSVDSYALPQSRERATRTSGQLRRESEGPRSHREEPASEGRETRRAEDSIGKRRTRPLCLGFARRSMVSQRQKAARPPGGKPCGLGEKTPFAPNLWHARRSGASRGPAPLRRGRVSRESGLKSTLLVRHPNSRERSGPALARGGLIRISLDHFFGAGFSAGFSAGLSAGFSVGVVAPAGTVSCTKCLSASR